jgi:hypothetical protein
VLVQLHEYTDPETGGRYTVKRYESKKAASADGAWRHLKVTLRPTNPEFQPIELTGESEDSVLVIAELLEFL